ncbi:response regulator [Sporocytophaga myxococcoides]|uniref:response regulator n=1 Tax=Sporocytophaga myxococcoides TaxID=153721 RepID=UPI00041B1DD4|nr:response regulator [Sporocytophaga myxococcoides]
MKKIDKILLVDNDNVNNFLNARLLKKLEIANEINVALNGKEAINHINKSATCPELILLDINMPVMDGFEFLNSYKTHTSSDPVIVVLTTSSNENDMSKLENHPSVMGYLNKPLTAEKINSVMEKHFS